MTLAPVHPPPAASELTPRRPQRLALVDELPGPPDAAGPALLEPADLGGRAGPLLARFEVVGDPPSKKNSPIPLHVGLPRDPGDRKRPMTLPEYFGALKRMAQDPAQDLVAELHRIESEYRLLILPNSDYAKAKRWWIPQAAAAHHQAGAPKLGTDKRPVMVGAVFYLGPRKHPDLLGLCEALADLLEAAGWLENDYHIARWWGGTRRERDVQRPRTEIMLWPWIAGAQETLPLFATR